MDSISEGADTTAAVRIVQMKASGMANSVLSIANPTANIDSQGTYKANGCVRDYYATTDQHC